MSLFPAYDENNVSASKTSDPEIVSTENNANWLKNSSFQPEIISTSRIITVSSDSSDCEFLQVPEKKLPQIISLDSDIEEIQSYIPPRSKKHKKSKKHKSSKEKVRVKYEPVVENVYFDDKIRDKGNFKVSTLCSRVRPLYDVSNKTLGFVSFKVNKKQPLRRYFALIQTPSQHSKRKDSKKSKNHPDPTAHLSVDPQVEKELQLVKEEETKAKIKEFNEKLLEDPHDVDLWIQYINFEDRDNIFENCPHNTRAESMKYQRKLAITERALENNPDSKLLLQLKLKFLSELSPADQYSVQLEQLIAKDLGNVVLWQALIAATRSSIALCTAPKILSLYAKCFGSLHLWSRSSPRNYDNNLLQILYHCLVFLRNAGLWEQMWEALRMNLTLNLGINKDSRNFKGSIDEKKLIGMEEIILTSQLPLNQLWLRVELLRENCHWISVSREELELIGDSHRFISPEDVTEYVHPLLAKGSNFRMAIYGLLALKVPLLPTRHVILEELGLVDCNWGIDSAESLLPLFFPCVGEVAGHRQRILLSTGLIQGGITSGPQYLRFHPAQEGFLDFIRDAFRTIAEGLKFEEKNSIYIWWLRFERCLIGLQKSEGIKSEKNVKKLRGILKEFLKKEENRNNLDFYREYAIIEREMGRWENGLNILQTAIDSKGRAVFDVRDVEDKKSLLSLYRTLIEYLLDVRSAKSSRISVLKIFAQMSPGNSEDEQIRTTESHLKELYEKFIEALENDEEKLETYFQTNFHYDAVMCYIYLLYATERDAGEIYDVFARCEQRSRENRYLQEFFYEGEIIFTQLICERGQVKINDLRGRLDIALQKFPDNFYMLSVFAGIESVLPNWCVRTSTETKRLWPAISLCLSGRARLHSELCQSDPTAMTAALNKLLHFHKRLARTPDIRNCPLMWRLYMLLLREHNLCESKGEEIYHESVALCPWARCIYIDAAEIAPQLLTQIQDVIKEKDLRMHVTPEELDILRG